MTFSAVCVLYTQDPDLVRRVKAYLRAMANLRHVEDPDRLEAVLQQARPALCVVDLRARESGDLIEQIQNEWNDVLIIALGTLRSEPLREVEQSGVYAAEDLNLERGRFQALVERAFAYLAILQENRQLQERSTSGFAESSRPGLARESNPGGSGRSRLPRFPRVFRPSERIEDFLRGLIENVADAAGVARAGIFTKIRSGDSFRLRAGLHCLPETESLEFNERDSLVRWFERNAHLISRANLSQVSEQSHRPILRRALDAFGAEVIAPLHARGRIAGWIFFGHDLTGQPFDHSDLERFMDLAGHVSTVLENALLYEEISIRKTLTDALLKSIPPGILAVDETGVIRSSNPTAERILGHSGSELVNKPIEAAGGTLAAFLRETLETGTDLPPRRWIDNNTRRSLSVEARCLLDHGRLLGAVAVIQDLTGAETLREKSDLLDRATFWTDLAASMSHEIRNPLVAIKTFAQLLPERFDDPDFRKEFNEIVLQEIDRLDKIITQINNFAHPPDVVLKPIDVRSSVKKGIEIARSRFGVNGGVAVDVSLANDLPKVLGDESALAEAFAHLVTNAAEAASIRDKPRITLAAKPLREGKKGGVIVTVHDNGTGISPELRDKVFSPFCTTKPRGMGLGLPIVKRTVFDHNGRVNIDSNSRGTSVSVVLPASGKNK